MADDSDADSDGTQEKTCFMHCDITAKGKITPFSDHSWGRFLEYVEKWTEIDSIQGDIARLFTAKHGSELNSAAVKPSNAGYHRSCYAVFANKSKVEKAHKALENKRRLAETNGNS